MVLGAFAKSTGPPPVLPPLPCTIPYSISQQMTELREMRFRFHAMSEFQRQQNFVQQMEMLQRQTLEFQRVQSEQLGLTQEMTFSMILPSFFNIT